MKDKQESRVMETSTSALALASTLAAIAGAGITYLSLQDTSIGAVAVEALQAGGDISLALKAGLTLTAGGTISTIISSIAWMRLKADRITKSERRGRKFIITEQDLRNKW